MKAYLLFFLLVPSVFAQCEEICQSQIEATLLLMLSFLAVTIVGITILIYTRSHKIIPKPIIKEERIPTFEPVQQKPPQLPKHHITPSRKKRIRSFKNELLAFDQKSEHFRELDVISRNTDLLKIEKKYTIDHLKELNRKAYK